MPVLWTCAVADLMAVDASRSLRVVLVVVVVVFVSSICPSFSQNMYIYQTLGGQALSVVIS